MAIGAASSWSIARSAPISSSSCLGWAKWTMPPTASVRHILKRQLPDGGWNIYYGGAERSDASVKAYFALKLAGHTADRPSWQEAREHPAPRRHSRMNTFSQLYLARCCPFPVAISAFLPVEMNPAAEMVAL